VVSWKDIRTLYVRELRSALRERGIVVNSVIVPIVLYPLAIWLIFTGVAFVSGQRAELQSYIMIRGLPEAHSALRRELESEPGVDLLFSEDPEVDIRAGKLDLVIDFIEVQDAPPLAEGNVGARVTYDASRDRSATARARVKRVIDRYRDRFLTREAQELGLSAVELQGFRVNDVNAASSSEMGRFLLGLLLPVMLVVMLAMGSVYPAIDATAGERENGTWETMMAAATSRTNILVAKYLYVATMSFLAGVLNVAAMMFTVRANLLPLNGSSGFTFAISLSAIPVLLAGAALLALLIAAGMMLLAAFARTFKEGQTLVSPFLVAFVLPLAFIQSPSQEYTWRLALVPVVNTAMMFREAIVGRYDAVLIAITLTVQAIGIAIALKIAAVVVRNENFVTGNYHGTLLKFAADRLIRRRNAGRPVEG
jgi:sodium transport system permease protein